MSKDPSDANSKDIGWKLFQAGAIMAAGLLSDNIVNLGWKLVTGRPAPKDAEAEAKIAEVIVFAVISGVIMALTKRVAVRGLAAWYGGDSKPASELLNPA